MAVFVVGMEIKRELAIGELKALSQARVVRCEQLSS